MIRFSKSMTRRSFIAGLLASGATICINPKLSFADEAADDATLEHDLLSGRYANSWRYNDGFFVSGANSDGSSIANAGFALLDNVDERSVWSHSDGVHTCFYPMYNSEMSVSDATEFGIDVSVHQGNIDWVQVRADKVDFAIIRCGYGSDYTNQDDKCFLQNVQGCLRNGIKIGIYLYSYAQNVDQARSEASHTLRLLKSAGLDPSDLDYPVYYDLEESGLANESNRGLLAQMAKTFCSAIEAAGYEAGVYANLNWWNNFLTDPCFSNWSRWVAQYNVKCSYAGTKDIWQCMSTGAISGIDGNVDINFSYRPVANTEQGRIQYRAHVQNIGWQSFRSEGSLSGTTGRCLSVEAVQISLSAAITESYAGSIRYCTHVQDEGWQDWVYDGSTSGTVGKARRTEAIRIELTGGVSSAYDVYYRVHVQDIGWMGWARNGERAGTQGLALRIEAFEVKLIAPGEPTPDQTSEAFHAPAVSYKTHVQDIGWQSSVSDGSTSGTTGRAKRLEAISVSLGDIVSDEYSGSIRYRTHVQDIGWQDWVYDGAVSGTTGKAKRLEAINIELTGDLATAYSVSYRAHVQDEGWQDWVLDGALAGTTGKAKRLEAIQIKLVRRSS